MASDECILGLMAAVTRPDGQPMSAPETDKFFETILTMLEARRDAKRKGTSDHDD